jgi:hypothetical protein
VLDAKIPIEEHLRSLGLTGEDGRPVRRAIAIGNRNLGMNHGHVAWQHDQSPRLFRVDGDVAAYGAWSCLTAWRDGRLTIEDLSPDWARDALRLAQAGRDVSDEVRWATFGHVVQLEGDIGVVVALAGEFSYVRHLLAYYPRGSKGAALAHDLYDGYPERFGDNVRRAWLSGAPRAKYVHNAVGLGPDRIVIVQKEGTVEEIGAALHDAGADDGVILDNGGSVACWVWWANDYAGGLVSPTVDYRPPASSVVALVLKGPSASDLPGGSVSYTVL